MSTTTSPPPSADRLQRTVADLPVVHLEADASTGCDGTIVVDGLVARPGPIALAELRAIEDRFLVADHHCVWGWSKPICRWRGTTLGAVLDHVGARADARFVTVRCQSSDYATCLHMADAREGILAWGLDGEPLAEGNGGPLRFQNPAWLWGYKGVKWAGRIEVGNEFTPGFWEKLVGDPEGRVPAAVLNQFHYWRGRRR